MSIRSHSVHPTIPLRNARRKNRICAPDDKTLIHPKLLTSILLYTEYRAPLFAVGSNALNNLLNLDPGNHTPYSGPIDCLISVSFICVIFFISLPYCPTLA